MFIKELFEGKLNEQIHKQFIRFGRGKFEKRAIIKVKRNSNVKLFASYELANDLVSFVSSLVPKIKVEGLLLSKKPFPNLKGKKKNILWHYEISKELDKKEIEEMLNQAYFLLFDCSAEGVELKVKKKLPQPSKASAELKVDEKFCKLELSKQFWPQLKSEFLFGLPDGKNFVVEHDYEISEIIIPEGLGNDFERIREEAKRKGKIIRRAIVDGKEIVNEKEFVA